MEQNEDFSITISQASIEDLDHCCSLLTKYREFYNSSTDCSLLEQYVEERIVRGDSLILLASSGRSAVPIGLAQVYFSFSTIALKKTWILNDLFVESSYRSRGVGRLLIQDCIRRGIEAGAAKVELKTQITNSRAQALYKSVGFTQDSEFVYFQKMI